jgi:hypothetical protein
MQRSFLQRQGQDVLLGHTNNCILLKDDVGKAKPSVYDLPPAQHAYGKTDLNVQRDTTEMRNS